MCVLNDVYISGRPRPTAITFSLAEVKYLLFLKEIGISTCIACFQTMVTFSLYIMLLYWKEVIIQLLTNEALDMM